MCWVAWEKLTLAKENGGLGFREVATFNDSLLAKIGWKLLQQPDSLLAQVLLGKYYHSSSFMEARIPTNASHGWRGIMEGREILKKGLGWIIGDGESTNVWDTSWLSPTMPLCPFGPPTQYGLHLKVKDLLLPNTTVWNLDAIRKHVPHHEDILKIILSSRPKADKLRWLPLKAGGYTSKSGYLLGQTSNSLTKVDCFKWSTNVWRVCTSPKLRMFLCKATRNALPLGKALAIRGVVAVAVFNGVESLHNWLVLASKMVALPPVGLGFTPLGRHSPESNKGARSWQAAKLLQTQKKPSQKTKDRVAAHSEAISCFSDASWLAKSQVCGLGWIFRNPQNVVIHQGSSSRPFVASALVAEALALKAAITSALALGVSRLACYSDCQDLVCLLDADGQANELDGILEDIRELCSVFLSCSFHHVSRLYNVEADTLAKSAPLLCIPPPLRS
ncbi:Ribonuclease H domain [Arabidopsis thaliana x Arabidopsis arenosa]|uniref:Ribonuclease H domain n=1 Tax=Arabidopsis thaliana x Arabidopsis arenosa TaxID=1240361 RepID=A0A8T2BFJ1_9BRAS|nr:Ribonuclease H domain [Arabidopsis thaliana x Arabidopsis arenosa]